MTEAVYAVDVLIRQIHAAGKSRLPVDYEDFAVVPIIIVRGDNRLDRCKLLGADPLPFQQFRIIAGKLGDFAHAIIHHPNIHASFYFLYEDLQDFSPHDSFFQDKKL